MEVHKTVLEYIFLITFIVLYIHFQYFDGE